MSREKFDELLKVICEDIDLADTMIRNDKSLLSVKNGIGETVLHFLAVENQLEEIAWLLEKGSDINTVNEFGNTPLSEAASLGYFELCKFLLENGADPRMKSKDGNTALSEAATNNEVEIVQLLLNIVHSNEPLSNYFSKITYDVLLDHESPAAKCIKLKGLKW